MKEVINPPTLLEYFAKQPFRSGMVVTFQTAPNTFKQVLIGDATVYQQPSVNDGGFGWDGCMDWKIIDIVQIWPTPV